MGKSVERKRVKVTAKTGDAVSINKGSGQSQAQSVKINIRIGDTAGAIKKKEQDKIPSSSFIN